MTPSLPSLEKICAAFGITLAQLFAEGEEAVTLTADQRQLLARWNRLTEEQRAALLRLLEVI